MIKELNLKRLRYSSIPMSFITDRNGVWDKEEWNEFCSMIAEKGYHPIDLDQVKLLVNESKAEFLSKSK